MRRASRRSYVESETDTDEEEEYESDGDAEDEEEEARLRTRRRQNSQQLNSESEENEAEEEDRRPGRLTFVMGPAKRSDQCFSWLLREFQGYGCYVPQLGDSVMYIPLVTKSSSMQWRILSHAAFGKRKRMFDSANLASSQI